jgi:uncharacterized protein Yka (UPF0111/DUF47 family)
MDHDLLPADRPRSILQRVLGHIFPKAPDFFAMLNEQVIQSHHTTDLLVQFMNTGEAALATEIKKDEHRADRVKVRNLHALNEAFATPFDREDIYRAVMHLDDVVNYCKSTVCEMAALGVSPDPFMRDMAVQLAAGMEALIAGFARLATSPVEAQLDAHAARKAERRVEKLYRKALAELFQGDDYLNMFRRREIYRHLANGADRMAACANTLHDIVVKTT